jgi:hypothetical protein
MEMQAGVNIPFAVGAVLSAVAALLHLGIIAGGPAWYRFFGAGERFARAAAQRKWYPALVAITAVYIVRGLGYAPLILAKGGSITPFVVWSSVICFAYGLVHLLGLVQRWPAL